MAKFGTFKISVEIQGLKINVEGDRELAPTIAQNVVKQVAASIQPAGLLDAPKNGQGAHPVIDVETAETPARRKRRGVARATSDSSSVLSWNHDASKWGTPLQSWKQPQKVNWLLYVVEQENVSKDMSPTEMANTFSAKFREAGLLKKGNISRDLGNNSDLFGSVDGRWFLKQGGKDAAAKLIQEAKGEKVAE